MQKTTEIVDRHTPGAQLRPQISRTCRRSNPSKWGRTLQSVGGFYCCVWVARWFHTRQIDVEIIGAHWIDTPWKSLDSSFLPFRHTSGCGCKFCRISCKCHVLKTQVEVKYLCFRNAILLESWSTFLAPWSHLKVRWGSVAYDATCLLRVSFVSSLRSTLTWRTGGTWVSTEQDKKQTCNIYTKT